MPRLCFRHAASLQTPDRHGCCCLRMLPRHAAQVSGYCCMRFGPEPARTALCSFMAAVRVSCTGVISSLHMAALNCTLTAALFACLACAGQSALLHAFWAPSLQDRALFMATLPVSCAGVISSLHMAALRCTCLPFHCTWLPFAVQGSPELYFDCCAVLCALPAQVTESTQVMPSSCAATPASGRQAARCSASRCCAV
jgi:hypothetical protein